MFHLPTLIFATAVCSLGFTVAMLMLRRLVPQETALTHWAGSSLLFLMALGLHTQRGHWPDELTWLLSNTLLVVGTALGWSGARALQGMGAWPRLLPWVVGTFGVLNMAMHLWWRVDQPRMALLSLAVAVCLAGAAREFWLLGNQRLKRTVRATSVLYAMGSVLFLVRAYMSDGTVIHPDPMAQKSWLYLMPYAFGMLFINWSTVAVAVIVGDKLLQSLTAALRKAQDSDRAKSAFLASVTHEWRTPLNAISGFAQLITNDEHTPREARQSAALIHTAGSQLLDVVNDLIDLRALQDSTLVLKFQISHLQPMVDQALEGLRPVAQQLGITLEAEGAATNPSVWVDPDRFKQVLTNLLSNAIKFNRPNGVARVHWEDDGQSVYLSVTDTGTGIPEALHHRVFTPLDRLGAESGDIAGTGVGLAISQRLVQRMGGTMGFQSQSGEGSTFWVSFPVALLVKGEVVLQTGHGAHTGPHTDYPSTVPVQHQPPAIPAGKQVLYVEDNPVNQKLVRAVFHKQLGIDVSVAATAEEGISLAQRQPPHLILMDLNLPGMDGYQALKALRANPLTRHIPVMAVTAQSRPEDLERGRAAGFDAYITKPLKLGNLISLAMQLIKR